jgi:hypothetical protein
LRNKDTRSIIFVIFKAECPCVLAHNLHILPAKTLESFPSHLAEGGREVDQVNAGEELRDVDVF